MTTMDVIAELGDDADLLMEPDERLNHQMESIATQISLLSEQYERIRTAKQFKRQLQDTNRVPVRLLRRDDCHRIVDVEMRILPLPDAIKLLRRPSDQVDTANLAGQVNVWIRDGYDVATSSALRTN